MSFPFYKFTCSKCQFNSSDLDYIGLYSYEGSTDLVSLNRALGWCNDCSNIAAIEILPCQQKINKLHDSISETQHRFEQFRNNLIQNRSWIKKLFNCDVILPSEIYEMKRHSEYDKIELENEQKRLKLLSARNSGPRCLNCGSTDCSLLPKLPTLPDPEYPLFSKGKPNQAIEINFQHPNCGGNLLVIFSEVWINIEPQHRVYDIEGCLIRIED